MSSTSPPRRPILTLRPSGRSFDPIRVRLSSSGETIITFDTWMGASRSAMPPLMFFWGLGRVWRLMKFTPCTSPKEFTGLSAGSHTASVRAVDKVGNVYVSIGGMSGPRGEIYKYTPSGEKSVLIDFGTPGVVGLAVDATGNVYVTRMMPPHNGVYRVDPQGNAVRLPGTEKIVFPNALAFDSEGNLFVTETFSFDPPLRAYPGLTMPYGLGGIWRIPKNGSAELWLRHELLSGTGLFSWLFPFPVGANGIAFYHGALYVANTEQGLIVRVPVSPGGAPAAEPVVAAVVPDPDPRFAMFGPPAPDGLALRVPSNFVVPVIDRHAVVRISADGSTWETLATVNDGLVAPPSVAFGTFENFITGREAVNMSRECLDYGSKIVGGVTPGRGGRDIYGIDISAREIAPLAERFAARP